MEYSLPCLSPSSDSPLRPDRPPLRLLPPRLLPLPDRLDDRSDLADPTMDALADRASERKLLPACENHDLCSSSSENSSSVAVSEDESDAIEVALDDPIHSSESVDSIPLVSSSRSSSGVIGLGFTARSFFCFLPPSSSSSSSRISILCWPVPTSRRIGRES